MHDSPFSLLFYPALASWTITAVTHLHSWPPHWNPTPPRLWATVHRHWQIADTSELIILLNSADPSTRDCIPSLISLSSIPYKIYFIFLVDSIGNGLRGLKWYNPAHTVYRRHQIISATRDGIYLAIFKYYSCHFYSMLDLRLCTSIFWLTSQRVEI